MQLLTSEALRGLRPQFALTVAGEPGPVVQLHPAGFRLRAAVELCLHDIEGPQGWWELRLSRDLLGHPENCVFAYEIAAALMATVPDPEVEPLVAELQAGCAALGSRPRTWLHSANFELNLSKLWVRVRALRPPREGHAVVVSTTALSPCPGCLRPIPGTANCPECGSKPKKSWWPVKRRP